VLLRPALQIADGSYAFVLHTANPLTGQLGEIFGELVPGLGEVLVSGLGILCAHLCNLLLCCPFLQRESLFLCICVCY
jgi:hypothetical protein